MSSEIVKRMNISVRKLANYIIAKVTIFYATLPTFVQIDISARTAHTGTLANENSYGSGVVPHSQICSRTRRTRPV